MKVAFFIILAVFALFFLESCGGVNRIPAVRDRIPDHNRERELAAFFSTEELPILTVTVSSNDWNRLLALYDANPRNEDCVPADFSVDRNGEVKALTNIGFRLRGNTFSRVRPEVSPGGVHAVSNARYLHAHFKLEFNQFYDSPGIAGMKGLNLKWFNGDPSYVREVYSYDLFRRFGVYTAVKSSYARLRIRIREDAKDVNFGVYHMLEPIDSAFVKARFVSNSDGYLWKCLWGADFKISQLNQKTGIEMVNPTNDKLSRRFAYDLKTRKSDIIKARASLNHFVSNLNRLKGAEFEEWVRNAIDVDLLLRAMAVNTILGMWDDYWVNQNNYYVYIDTAGRLYFIPYDYDNTLGTSQILPNSMTQNVLSFGKLDGSRPLIQKVLEVPEFKLRYSNYIAELVSPSNRYFDVAASTNRITRWHALIRPYVSNDTGTDMEIIDAPAGWGSAPFYRLLSGDHYGGPMPANVFTSRAYSARVQLGIIKPEPESDLKVSFEGISLHPNYYLYTRSATNSILVILSGPAVTLRLQGLLNTSISNPPLTNRFQLVMPDQRISNVLFRDYLMAEALDADGLKKRAPVKIMLFESGFDSAVVSNGMVTFRARSFLTNTVEIQGEFNDWGKKPWLMENKGQGMWELTTNASAMPAGALYFYRVQKTRIRFPDIANTDNEGRGHHMSVYRGVR